MGHCIGHYLLKVLHTVFAIAFGVMSLDVFMHAIRVRHKHATKYRFYNVSILVQTYKTSTKIDFNFIFDYCTRLAAF